MKEQLEYSEKNGMTIIDWITTVLSAVYVVSPVDLIPDAIPVVGWMDDVLVAITGISTVINSQLSKANTTLSEIFKFIRVIAFSLWAIFGALILIFGTLIYQILS
ncbi:MAG: YkvA family protein [Psychroflexus sp.]